MLTSLRAGRGRHDREHRGRVHLAGIDCLLQQALRAAQQHLGLALGVQRLGALARIHAQARIVAEAEVRGVVAHEAQQRLGLDAAHAVDQARRLQRAGAGRAFLARCARGHGHVAVARAVDHHTRRVPGLAALVHQPHAGFVATGLDAAEEGLHAQVHAGLGHGLHHGDLHELGVEAHQVQRAVVEHRADVAAQWLEPVEQLGDHAAHDPVAARRKAAEHRDAADQLAADHRRRFDQQSARAAARGRDRGRHAGAAAADHDHVEAVLAGDVLSVLHAFFHCLGAGSAGKIVSMPIAIASSARSLFHRPSMARPIGRPSSDSAIGTVTPGSTAVLVGPVLAM
jgi:hypothetical protein